MVNMQSTNHVEGNMQTPEPLAFQRYIDLAQRLEDATYAYRAQEDLWRLDARNRHAERHTSWLSTRRPPLKFKPRGISDEEYRTILVGQLAAYKASNRIVPGSTRDLSVLREAMRAAKRESKQPQLVTA